MTQENKELLLKDLCARLPYGVKVEVNFTEGKKVKDLSGYADIINQDICVGCSWMPISDNIKPYLRPMSSMTEEEKKEFNSLINGVEERCINAYGKGGYTLAFTEVNDWLNAHYFDYRSLISIGLALEAPEGMYNINEK